MNFKNSEGFIQNIVMIALILSLAFLSQQSYVKPFGKKLYLQVKAQSEAYGKKTRTWFQASIYPQVSGEVESSIAPIKKIIAAQKNNVAENIWEKIFTIVSGTFKNKIKFLFFH